MFQSGMDTPYRIWCLEGSSAPRGISSCRYSIPLAPQCCHRSNPEDIPCMNFDPPHLGKYHFHSGLEQKNPPHKSGRQDTCLIKQDQAERTLNRNEIEVCYAMMINSTRRVVKSKVGKHGVGKCGMVRYGVGRVG